jgi:hypothetical protein
LTVISFWFAKPPDISEGCHLQLSVIGMRPHLEDLEEIIQSEDLVNRCTSTRDAVLPSNIPVDGRHRSRSIKSVFSSTSIRRPAGAIDNTFKLMASRTAKIADQAFYRLTN